MARKQNGQSKAMKVAHDSFTDAVGLFKKSLKCGIL